MRLYPPDSPCVLTATGCHRLEVRESWSESCSKAGVINGG